MAPKNPIEMILVSQGLITEEELDKGLEEQKHSGGRLGVVLVQLGYTTQEEIEATLDPVLQQKTGLRTSGRI